MKLKLRNKELKKVKINYKFTLLFLSLSISIFGQTTRFVNGFSGTNSGDCTNPGSPCETIFYAFGMSVSGDAIDISEGIYTEFFEINKSISLNGAGTGVTIIQAGISPELSTNSVFWITPGYEVAMTDFTIRHGNALNGGGIFNFGSIINLTNISFEDNFASNYGGGLQNSDGFAILTDVIFRNNIAVSSGGGMSNDTSIINFLKVSFINNESGGSGGAIYNVNTTGVCKNIIVSGNSALNSGGGIENYNNSFPSITNALFSGNKAGTNGGALSNIFQSSPMLTNITFSGNNAGGLGGAIYNLNGSSPNLDNIIIWANSAANDTSNTHASISNHDSSNPLIFHSLIENSGGSSNWNSVIGVNGAFNLDEDPIFIEPINPEDAPSVEGNLRLMEESPAIDSGNPHTAIALFPTDENNDPVDLDWNPRIYFNQIDIGAYEGNDLLSVNYPRVNIAVTLYPNPTTGIIKIKTYEDIDQIEIISINGRKLSCHISDNGDIIDISHLSTGIYFIRITANNLSQSYKIIKE